MDRKSVAVRLTAAGRARLRRLADHYGISQAATIEVALATLEDSLMSNPIVEDLKTEYGWPLVREAWLDLAGAEGRAVAPIALIAECALRAGPNHAPPAARATEQEPQP